MTGWVRISREVFDHPVFQPGEMTEREAWLWLIAHAAWKDTHHNIRGVVYIVPRGSLFVTLREMQAAWRWQSEKRVRGFLDRLEAASMIGRKTDAAKTQLTICNYDKCQEAGRTQDAAGTQPGRIKETREQDRLDDDVDARANASASLADRCLDAAGLSDDPRAVMWPIYPIAKCRDAGASVEADILPTIKRIAAQGHRFASWAYFSQAIMDAKAAREAPAPVGRATGPPRQRRETAGDAAAELEAMFGNPHDPDHSREPSATVPRLAYSAGR